MTSLPSVLAQVPPVDPSWISALLDNPNGVAIGAITMAIGLFWQNQTLHSKHVDLLEKILPISLKLTEAVDRLERRLDRLDGAKP